MRLVKLTDEQFKAVQLILDESADLQLATPEQMKASRAEWDGIDMLEIQDDAVVSQGEDGYWIQAWVWMPN